MDHDRVRDSFTCYHDGDLSDEARADLEEHLKGCDECRKEWEGFRQTVDEISGLLQMKPPADFAKGVEQRIKKRSRGRFFGTQKNAGMQFAIVSFILILLFMLAYLVLTATDEITIIEDDGSEETSKVEERGEGGR